MNRHPEEDQAPSGTRGKKDLTGSSKQLVELVRRAQRGDSDAFQSLYVAYSKRILNYLFRMTGSRSAAEDLAQDTFVMAFRKIDTVKDPARFQSWLFRIAQNNTYQRFRGQKVRLESIDASPGEEDDEARDLPSSGQSPQQEALSVELEGRIQEAIAELPEKYRTVFVLSAVQQMSYQQISGIVGRSLSSVKSDIHRARLQVRDKIKDYLGDNYGMSGLY